MATQAVGVAVRANVLPPAPSGRQCTAGLLARGGGVDGDDACGRRHALRFRAATRRRPIARRESDRESALGPSHRCLEMQRGLHGVRQRLPERERLARHRASDDRCPLDLQADGEGPWNRRDLLATHDVPALRQAAMRGCLSYRRLVQASGRHRPRRQAHLHWLSVLHDGVPLQSALVHPRAARRPKPYAPRGKGTVESCTLCVHRVDEGRTPACVEACNDMGGGAMLFGDSTIPRVNRQARRCVSYYVYSR